MYTFFSSLVFFHNNPNIKFHCHLKWKNCSKICLLFNSVKKENKNLDYFKVFCACRNYFNRIYLLQLNTLVF